MGEASRYGKPQLLLTTIAAIQAINTFTEEIGLTAALKTLEDWRTLMRTTQPHENLGEAFEDTSEYFVHQVRLATQSNKGSYAL